MSKQYEDDDGRTIVSMDVEGMPWHDKRVRRENHKQRTGTRDVGDDVLTKRQTARWIWRSLLGAFTVIFIIGGVIVLLIFIEWIIWKIKSGQ